MIRLPMLMQIYIFMDTAKEIPLKQFLIYSAKIPNLTSNERCSTNFQINAKTPISLSLKSNTKRILLTWNWSSIDRILKLVSCKRKKKKKWEMRVIMFSCDLRLKRNVLTCVFYGNVTKWAVSELKLSRIEGPARAMIDRDDRSFLESTLAYTHHAIVSNLWKSTYM